MPYIEPNRREALNLGDAASSPGELNYKITRLVHNYLIRVGKQRDTHVPGYTEINEVIGVLDCAKMELYRMVAAPYENGKAAVNGYVSNLDTPAS